ncbi:MAG TPA: lysophospholipid acyltransferase family protein [Saprospiraceae bacterium]|nr:lysophospholipid acyltransferase family protein [Saprospiraceae bacterium]
MKTLRIILRFLFFAAYTSWIVARIAVLNLLLGQDIHRSMRIRKAWASRLIPAVGIQLRVFGQIPDRSCLIVSNHRSYLDPILVLKDVNVFPVAKAELANWPIIGKGAKMAGILYVKREHAGSRVGTIKQMQDLVSNGFSVLIFPEGTTSGRPDTLPFKKGAFKMAAQSGMKIVPVAICFDNPADFWIGKISFLSHAAKRFGEPAIRVSVYYGPAITNENPELLLENVQRWINDTLNNTHATHSS